MKTQAELFALLDQLNIANQTFNHPPLFTCEQAKPFEHMLPCAPTKNLFLKDDINALWLVVAISTTTINLRALSKKLPAKNLRFAKPEQLVETLGVQPGSVTPFALINDLNHHVRVIFDTELFKQESVGFHPLSNDATTVIKPQDLTIFVNSCGNQTLSIDFSELAVQNEQTQS